MPYATSGSPNWGPYWRVATTNSVVGPVDAKPYVWASVNVTNPGWYILNFVASRGKASLRKWDGSSFPIQTQWDYTTSPNPYESYPAFFNLAAGSHYFCWVPDPGYFYVSEVSLTKF